MLLRGEVRVGDHEQQLDCRGFASGISPEGAIPTLIKLLWSFPANSTKFGAEYCAERKVPHVEVERDARGIGLSTSGGKTVDKKC